MEKKEQFGGLDYFKMIAALLVVTIHTSPLASFNVSADFVLTRVIARIAVPFFFMVTGFFVLPQYLSQQSNDDKPLRRFLKKTLLLYVAAIIIYLPVNFYAGQFAGIQVADAIRMLVFDGTLYHLWYLPASLFSVWIICCIGHKISLKTWIGISLILYVIGLFGDSYYGVIDNIHILREIYDFMFRIFSYTRNGIFYAPIFLIMGAGIRQSQDKVMQSQNIDRKGTMTAGVVISFFLMIIEGLILRYFKLQRHDSMYFTLLPSMYFLFRFVISYKMVPAKCLRVISMWVYIIHPLMIIVVRGVAKVVHLETLLIENSLIHYIVVCLLSCAFAIVAEWSTARIQKRKS